MRWLLRAAFLVLAGTCIPACGGGSKTVVITAYGLELRVPGDFNTIQQAINAVPAGQLATIFVSPKTGSTYYWTESLILKSGIKLFGNPYATQLFGTITIPAGATGCEVNGFQLSDLVLAADILSDALFERCTFITTGARVTNNARGTFKNCTFDGTTNLIGTTGLEVASGNAVISRCLFSHWDTALKNSIPGGGSAGSFTDCLFEWNFVNVTGPWTGTVTMANIKYTNRIGNDFFLDTFSPAIVAGGFWGAWEEYLWLARPAFTAVPLGGAPTGALQKVLEVDVVAVGTAGAINVLFDMSINQLTNKTIASVPMEIRAVGPGGTIVLASGTFNIAPGPSVIPFTSSAMLLDVGIPQKLQLWLDFSGFTASGDNWEGEHYNSSWGDGTGQQNTNGADIGLPVLGGAWSVP